MLVGFLLLPGSVLAQEAASAADPSRVLILGDSHMMGYFGRYLHKSLNKRLPGVSVYVVAACGRGSPGFVKNGRSHCGVKTIDYGGKSRIVKGCKKNPCKKKDGAKCKRNACRIPKLEHLFEIHRPELTIIQLGGNSWFLGSVRDGWSKVRPHVEALADQVVAAGSRCLWVSPADSLGRPRKKNRQFTEFLGEVLHGKCEVFVSFSDERPYLDYRAMVKRSKLKSGGYDGVHYGWFGAAGRKAQRHWGNDIIDAALSLSTHD